MIAVVAESVACFVPEPRHESRKIRGFADLYEGAPGHRCSFSTAEAAELIRDFDLHKQLSESTGKIPGPIGEGFGQGTDRHFAHYLVIARGSALETRGHLATAQQREYISRDEEIAVSGLYQDLADMLSGFIAYLRRSDRRDRW